MPDLNPALLALVREYRGLTQNELAERAQISQGYISKYENGLAHPSEEYLERIAESLDWPIDFFLRPDSVYGFGSACLYHRRKASIPVPVLRQIQALANVLRMGLGPLLREVSIEAQYEMPRLDLADYNDSPETIAQLVRGTWRLPLGPIANLTRSIEGAGGLVMRVDLGTRLLDAVSHWPPEAPPLFLVNAAAPGDRLRFSLAHELGHIVMHATPTPDMEREADHFAAEFLMPGDELRGDLTGLTLSKAAQLKPRWKVSIAALVLRARDLGAITPRQATRLYMDLSRLGYRLLEPVVIPVEEPSTVRHILQIHQEEHGYSMQELGLIAGIGETEVRRRLFGSERLLQSVK